MSAPAPPATATQVLAELAEVQRQIDACDAETRANYDRRLVLLQRGRDLGLTVRELAEAIGAREGAVGQALHKARRRSG